MATDEQNPPTALAGDDVQSVVDTLADRLGRSVAVDDPLIHLIAASRHFGDEGDTRVRSVIDRQISADLQRWVLAKGIADWTEPGRVTGEPDFELAPRSASRSAATACCSASCGSSSPTRRSTTKPAGRSPKPSRASASSCTAGWSSASAAAPAWSRR
ncbi:hypothetical protein [Streptomyces sp. NPDC050548]|uniref:hypothetical protein n=1 Tax=Streptomyces sp. NPDC050548 TaxID=3365629 RepID=UPI0037AC21AC